MDTIIPASVTTYFIVLLVLAIAIPVIISTIYVLVKKEKVTTILVGALTFFLFAIVLESIPKTFLFSATNPAGAAILSNGWLFSIVGAALAGIFEESGRFVAFKFFLKKRNTKSTATAYGLGHGFFEVIFILAYGSIQYLTYISMINGGSFEAIVNQVAAIDQSKAAALEALPASLAAVNFSQMPLSILERSAAVLFHIGASYFVFAAVKTKGKGYLYPVAILLHICLDIFAGLATVGIITNIYVLEGIVAVYGLAVFIGGLLLNKKLPVDKETETIAQ